MDAAKVAVLLQPPGRGHRIARALEAHGYRVSLYRDVNSAERYLRRVRAVGLLFVDQGQRWFAGNDLLSCIEDFPSMRAARVVVTVKNPNSIFAAALRVRGTTVLVHPVRTEQIAAIADEAEHAAAASLIEVTNAFLRLREEAVMLRARTAQVVEESRRLRHNLGQVRRSVGR